MPSDIQQLVQYIKESKSVPDKPHFNKIVKVLESNPDLLLCGIVHDAETYDLLEFSLIASGVQCAREIGYYISQEFHRLIKKNSVIKTDDAIYNFLMIYPSLLDSDIGPDKDTPLILSAYYGNLEAVEIILKLQPDVTKKADGRTALRWAEVKENTKAAGLIREYINGLFIANLKTMQDRICNFKKNSAKQSDVQAAVQFEYSELIDKEANIAEIYELYLKRAEEELRSEADCIGLQLLICEVLDPYMLTFEQREAVLRVAAGVVENKTSFERINAAQIKSLCDFSSIPISAIKCGESWQKDFSKTQLTNCSDSELIKIGAWLHEALSALEQGLVKKKTSCTRLLAKNKKGYEEKIFLLRQICAQWSDLKNNPLSILFEAIKDDRCSDVDYVLWRNRSLLLMKKKQNGKLFDCLEYAHVLKRKEIAKEINQYIYKELVNAIEAPRGAYDTYFKDHIDALCKFLDFFPQMIYERIKDRYTPLMLALRQRSGQDCVQAILMRRPKLADQQEASEAIRSALYGGCQESLELVEDYIKISFGYIVQKTLILTEYIKANKYYALKIELENNFKMLFHDLKYDDQWVNCYVYSQLLGSSNSARAIYSVIKNILIELIKGDETGDNIDLLNELIIHYPWIQNDGIGGCGSLLGLAVMQANKSAVDLLLQHELKMSDFILDGNGNSKTLIQLAEESKFDEIAETLKSYIRTHYKYQVKDSFTQAVEENRSVGELLSQYSWLLLEMRSWENVFSPVMFAANNDAHVVLNDFFLYEPEFLLEEESVEALAIVCGKENSNCMSVIEHYVLYYLKLNLSESAAGGNAMQVVKRLWGMYPSIINTEVRLDESYNDTVIFVAVKNEDLELLKWLVEEHNPEIDMLVDNKSVLELAVGKKNEEIIALLSTYIIGKILQALQSSRWEKALQLLEDNPSLTGIESYLSEANFLSPLLNQCVSGGDNEPKQRMICLKLLVFFLDKIDLNCFYDDEKQQIKSLTNIIFNEPDLYMQLNVVKIICLYVVVSNYRPDFYFPELANINLASCTQSQLYQIKLWVVASRNIITKAKNNSAKDQLFLTEQLARMFDEIFYFQITPRYLQSLLDKIGRSGSNKVVSFFTEPYGLYKLRCFFANYKGHELLSLQALNELYAIVCQRRERLKAHPGRDYFHMPYEPVNQIYFDIIMRLSRIGGYDITRMLPFYSVSSLNSKRIFAILKRFMPLKVEKDQWDISGLKENLMRDGGLEFPIEKWIEENDQLDGQALANKIAGLIGGMYLSNVSLSGFSIHDLESKNLFFLPMTPSDRLPNIYDIDEMKQSYNRRTDGKIRRSIYDDSTLSEYEMRILFREYPSLKAISREKHHNFIIALKSSVSEEMLNTIYRFGELCLSNSDDSFNGFDSTRSYKIQESYIDLLSELVKKYPSDMESLRNVEVFVNTRKESVVLEEIFNKDKLQYDGCTVFLGRAIKQWVDGYREIRNNNSDYLCHLNFNLAERRRLYFSHKITPPLKFFSISNAPLKAGVLQLSSQNRHSAGSTR